METGTTRLQAVRLGRRLLLLLILAVAAVLSSDSTPIFDKHDKAFYRDARVINFVRPGLEVNIVSASIEADGTISARKKRQTSTARNRNTFCILNIDMYSPTPCLVNNYRTVGIEF